MLHLIGQIIGLVILVLLLIGTLWLQYDSLTVSDFTRRGRRVYAFLFLLACACLEILLVAVIYSVAVHVLIQVMY
ncbi:hypothetical protein SALINJAH_7 [Bacillus phage SalinJah]|uniref:Uncharacterized protein n=1 Tax=Bacillus phage SalinJah TaxID=1837830 RepID=A0A173GBS1_9CAUD|nr:hypothetical protein SALINJAH_7 [Bacillus phage SalinJah]ANH50655.1 hypothetical protein SALINJAH_7 [Bacillus phage SalinJah]